MKIKNHCIKIDVEDIELKLKKLISPHLKKKFKKNLPFEIEVSDGILVFTIDHDEYEIWDSVYEQIQKDYSIPIIKRRFTKSKAKTITYDEDIYLYFVPVLLEEIYERKVEEIVFSVGYESGHVSGEGYIYILFE